MRNPNRFGTVYKLSGKRRNPYIVRKFEKWEIIDGKEKATYSTIGYAKTRKEGLELLAKYNSNPYDISGGKLTFKDVFEKFSKTKFESISPQNIKGYKASYEAVPELHNMYFVDIKLDDLEKAIENCGKHYPTIKKIKTLINQMYGYAMAHEICIKDYAQYVDISKYSDINPNSISRTIFTKDEIQVLWNNSSNIYIKIILLLIYSGLRIQTLFDLKKENVHLNERYLFIEKDKDTRKKGKNDYFATGDPDRNLVPIH